MGDGLYLCSLQYAAFLLLYHFSLSLKDSYIWTGQREEYIVHTPIK